MRKQVLIVAGANGSGKTTFARSYEKKYRLQFVNTDEIAKSLNRENVVEPMLEAARASIRRIHQLLAGGESFIFESTLSGRSLPKLINNIKASGYALKIIFLFLETPDMCIERIKERVLKGGHTVPDNDVIRRYYRSKQNFWNMYKKEADEWFLIYNSELQFNELAIGVGETYVTNSNNVFDAFMDGIEEEKQ